MQTELVKFVEVNGQLLCAFLNNVLPSKKYGLIYMVAGFDNGGTTEYMGITGETLHKLSAIHDESRIGMLKKTLELDNNLILELGK